MTSKELKAGLVEVMIVHRVSTSIISKKIVGKYKILKA